MGFLAIRKEASNAGMGEQGSPKAGKLRALVICAHLRPSRDKRRTRYFMQPLSGLHVGSLIDQRRFDVRLHHEDWHGPFDPTKGSRYDIVFLAGLQPDFDRMRQLSYFFRRSGAKVIAGGSVCTCFPEFAAQFFDAVCAGSVDIVPEVIDDYLNGSLKQIYRARSDQVAKYEVDYSLFARSGIHTLLHLMEASRGCSFRCTFCVVPNEAGTHVRYDLGALASSLESALASSPWWSLQRWYPMVMFLDNNFSDDREHMLRVALLMRSHAKLRAWGALVTQNVLHDRGLIRHLADSKCMVLFVGLETLDQEMLRRYNKKQNLSRRHNVIDDIAFAESNGIAICYGFLFDHRHQTAKEMERQIRAIADNPLLPMPVYLSVVAPLAGTASFWDDLRMGHLAPNLRLRDLDGETIGHTQLGDRTEDIVNFIERIFRRPWEVVGRFGILAKTLRRVIRARTWNPVRWYILVSMNLHCFLWSRSTPDNSRTYLAGSDMLDPQYFEVPPDLAHDDRVRYFEPIKLTDERGDAEEWLRPYIPLSPRTAQPVAFHRSSAEAA